MISYFVGLDISQATLDVGFFPEKIPHFQVKNDPEGFAQLIACLSELEVERVLLEATGGYERAVLRALRREGLNVVRVNPKRSRDYTSAMGKIAKTDKIDAQMLAKFAREFEDLPQVEPNLDRDELGELIKLRGNLVQHRDDDKRRIKQTICATAITTYTDHIVYLGEKIKELDEAIEKASNVLDSDTTRRLMSVKGIGVITCGTLMAYLPELGTVTGRKIAGLAGLAPYNNDSGKKNGPRSIEGGRYRVRCAIYMSMWSMIRHDPDFNARYNALMARGKRAKVAAVACMRVLLVQLNAMLRDGTEWKEPKLKVPAP
ncbi:IS110 family transposase [Pseudomonas sp. WOUb67]|uniref:IS110 family transposase n=1 Tax=Pseudomonas sp. WOUb67 TaxID=3161136 RepID=UPI003CF72C44